MRPFFMSIVSHSDHWMFISSTGGLTAGRKNSDFALFPYYTDDKITESAETTGSKTVILVENPIVSCSGSRSLPTEALTELSGICTKTPTATKSFLKSLTLTDLTFRYQWAPSERFGFVRHATLTSSANDSVYSDTGRGQNILPYGVPKACKWISNLVDAYKKCELEEYTRDL